ncbi:MAG: hypothetical protein KDD11_19365 [Acidobacteria bacterium]|nr:hypothetical protein [Acidobacteriota bacterium]
MNRLNFVGLFLVLAFIAVAPVNWADLGRTADLSIHAKAIPSGEWTRGIDPDPSGSDVRPPSQPENQ